MTEALVLPTPDEKQTKSRSLLMQNVATGVICFLLGSHFARRVFSPQPHEIDDGTATQSRDRRQLTELPPLAQCTGQPFVSTMNVLNGKTYPHHPVMLEVKALSFPVEKDWLTEWNGLKVPARFDCNIFNGGKSWGSHGYFWEVPTRWVACWQHYAEVKSGMLSTQPRLPLVDDEYNEHVAVYQSVLRAGSRFVMAELGARWGTWGARSIAFWRSQRGSHAPYTLHLVEASTVHCAGIRMVAAKNQLNYTLDCAMASVDKFGNWLRAQPHVDLIDLDIQGGEEVLVPGVFGLIEEKVYRVIIGTHSADIHAKIKQLFRSWTLIWEAPYTTHEQQLCVHKKLRRSYDARKSQKYNWTGLIADDCYHDTPRGPVAAWDGELIYDNPAFVDMGQAFSLADTSLRVGELKVSRPPRPPEDRGGGVQEAQPVASDRRVTSPVQAPSAMYQVV